MSTLPFDKIAKEYDSQFTHSNVGQLQRQRVYHFLQTFLKENNIKNILEFNCGTGEDAVWFAEKKYQILATDNSKEMIEVAKQKANKNSQNIDFQVLALEDLTQISNKIPTDLVFSNFGGLNCLSPKQLQNWADEIGNHIKKDGFIIAVVLGKFCAWETLYFLLKRKWFTAWRRLNKNAVEAKLENNNTIPIWYYSPNSFSHFFKNNFKTVKIRPIGFALPPSYLNPFFQKRPQSLSFLNKMETQFGNQKIWSKLSDHYLIILQKKGK